MFILLVVLLTPFSSGLSFDEQQRLIFNTMELSDSKSAAEAGLKKGSVLHLVRKKN